MTGRKRSMHTKNFNFRPSTEENPDPKGTTPTCEPTSVKEIFMLMVLYLCKKLLFFDTNLKIGIYLGCLFLVSLIADVLTIPKIYLSRSDNIFNKFFVKFAWGWNLMLLVPFVILTSFTYCCGQKHRIFKDHLLRVGVATFFWWFWITVFNYVEASYGRCGNLNFNTKGTCLREGHLWNGFDLSGHSFILIYGSLFIIEEARCIINWDGIREHIRLEEHVRIIKETKYNSNPLRNLSDQELKILKLYYEKYTPYIRCLFILIAALQVLWDVMLICTMLYYHVMVEKFLGGLAAIITWFITYRIWFAHPNLFPKLPGEGVFKYIKTVIRQPPLKRNVSSTTESQTPHFMGRPLYTTKQQETANTLNAQR